MGQVRRRTSRKRRSMTFVVLTCWRWVCVSAAGRQEIVAQVGGGLGVGILPASGETLGGAPGLGAVEGESVEIPLTAGLCEPCR